MLRSPPSRARDYVSRSRPLGDEFREKRKDGVFEDEREAGRFEAAGCTGTDEV